MSDDASAILEFIAYVGVMVYAGMEINKAEKEGKQEGERIIDESNRRAFLNKDVSDKLIKRLNANNNEVAQYYNDAFSLTLFNEYKKIVIYDNGIETTCLYDNLINIEVIIDESIVSSPSLGDAVVGGLLFGGAGAIIGSSSKSYHKTIKTVVLRLSFDDIKRPIHDLSFLAMHVAIPADKPYVKKILEDVNNCYGSLAAIVAKRKESQTDVKTQSIADELLKLKKLLDDGVISKDEFEAAKRKLL